ncbi:hypothetical protein [Lignipirellula cremea]|uniref:hypothetical protein n=1 Tax=Lignipirellula cremea TaxID=2528010 RepID=UPI0011A446E8|nr:hypothetical protein [Lignipirellula cremea]
MTGEQKADLRNDLMTLAEGATRPSSESVATLADDLQSAWADQSLSKPEKAQLASDILTVMNSANISPEELQQVIADVESILEASNVTPEDAQNIAADLQAIAKELQANAAAVGSQDRPRLGDRPLNRAGAAPKSAVQESLRQRLDR